LDPTLCDPLVKGSVHLLKEKISVNHGAYGLGHDMVKEMAKQSIDIWETRQPILH